MDQGEKQYEELENKKSEIVTRFLSREKVQIYFDVINAKKILSKEHLNVIKGIGEEVKEDITDLFNIYGIFEVYQSKNSQINHSTWWYDLSPLEDNSADLYLPLFFREFSVYPVSLIKKSTLKCVYFVESLTFCTDSYSQYRAAVPDYCYDTMAMVYCCKERSVEYIRNVIHHEFFHFIDYVEDGKIYGSDPSWDVLNTPGFQYGNGGANNRVWKPLNPELEGFLNFYSTTGIEEDKAEIFAFMMNQPGKIHTHPCLIIKNKMQFILDMFEKFDKTGLGNSEFWDWMRLFRENDK